MTVARVGAAKATTSTATSVTPAYNQSPTAGNLLVLGVTCNKGTAPTCTTPTGWTAGPTGGTNVTANFERIFLFWKFATGGDAAPSLTVASDFTDAIVEEWSGLSAHDADSTVGVNNQNNTAAGNCNSGPLTTTAASGWIWSFVGASAGAVAKTLTWGGGSASSSGFYNAPGWGQTASATQSAATIGTYTPTLAFSAGNTWAVGATASMSFTAATPSSGAALVVTTTTTATGTRGVVTTAVAVAATVAVVAAGVVGIGTGATLASTVTVTATGTVATPSPAKTGDASTALTVSVTASGVVTGLSLSIQLLNIVTPERHNNGLTINQPSHPTLILKPWSTA